MVASQLDEAFNAALAECAPDVKILDVPRGPPAALPPEAKVLIAAPFRKAGDPLPVSPPHGWPFDVKWVQLVSGGIDFYPDWLFKGPVVTSAKDASAVALAEFALAAIFAEAKRLPEIWIQRPDEWTPSPIRLVAGKTLGLAGFGAIGRALAPRAQALGMSVVAIRGSDAPIEAPGVEQLQGLGELFERSDHVVLAAPATPGTFRMVNRLVLDRAKPGLHLINVARGVLIEDDDLLAALDEGRVGRATLDVTHPEPLPFNHRYYAHPRVRLSPNISAHSPDSRRSLAARFAENLSRFRQGASLEDVVDPTCGY